VLLSEDALSKDWDTPEENEAWASLEINSKQGIINNEQ
jgi:hypothetical protein